MTHRAHRDHLDDGWTRSALTDPYPFGESLPDEWLDVELNFYRRTGGTANSIGGFKGRGAPLAYLICNGKAEIEQDAGIVGNAGGEAGATIGNFVSRHYSILIPMPGVPGNDEGFPRKGDRVWWYDAVGRRIDVPLKAVDVPEGLADHIEIISEDFE